MQFKRNEGFRFVFGEPLEANFVVLLDGKAENIEQSRNQCGIIDVSPRGMKILTEKDMKQYNNQFVQLEIHFKLDMIEIKAIGEIVWSKQFGQKFQYGICFTSQSNIDELIVSELKARRKREIATNRLNRI